MRLAIALAAAAAATVGISSFAAAGTRFLPLSASGQAVTPNDDETGFTIASPADPVYSDYDSHTTTWTERRAVFEFDLSGLPRGATIDTADLHFTVSDVHPRIVQSQVQYPQINFFGYAGNNVVDAADANPPHVSLGGGDPLTDVGPWTVELDQVLIQSYADAHAAAVGITAYPLSTDESVGFWTTGANAPTIEITYTLFGDANLDDRIDADDYALIDRGYAAHLTGWSNGDFNSDGVVNAADYLIIDTAYGQAQSFSPAFLSQRQSQFGPAYVSQLLASIPEPSVLICLFAALPPLAHRRRIAKHPTNSD